MTDKQINNVLQAHRHLPFVKRIFNTSNYEPLDNGDGSHSSHSMSYSEAGGKHYVYPTVLMTSDGTLKRFSGDEAWDLAVK